MPYADFIPSYIEVLAGLLVFGVTLPTLFINIPPRLRAIRDKHANFDLSRFGIDERLRLSTFLQPRWTVTVIVLSILYYASFLVTPPDWMVNLGLDPRQTFFHQHAAYFIFAVLSLNIFVTAVFMFVLSSYTKERLLRDIDRKCRQQALKGDGRIPPYYIKSLRELGTFCDAGHDKESVLLILDGLGLMENLHIDSRLEVARAVQDTIVDGNEQNYIFSMDILQGSFRTAKEKTIRNGNDEYEKLRLADILRTLENVIIQAFVLRNPRVTAAIMTGYDEISMQEPNDYARAFLRIGCEALELQEEHHAGHGLDKLHTRITELISREGEHKEAIHNYFGLLSHFWQRGNTVRQHALNYLEELQRVYRWGNHFIDRQMIEARHHFERVDLITADYLEQMVFEYRQLQYARKFLLEIDGIGKERSNRILMHYPSIELLRQADEAGIRACGIFKTMAERILMVISENIE